MTVWEVRQAIETATPWWAPVLAIAVCIVALIYLSREA